MRIGNPDCNVAIPDTAHPFTTCPLQFETFQSGRRQYPLSTNLCRASANDSDRDLFGSVGLTEFSKLEASSIDLLQVYEAKSCNPCENRLLSCA